MHQSTYTAVQFHPQAPTHDTQTVTSQQNHLFDTNYQLLCTRAYKSSVQSHPTHTQRQTTYQFVDYCTQALYLVALIEVTLAQQITQHNSPLI